MTAAKDIRELMDTDGHIETSWEGMARISMEYFTNILGARHNTQPPPDEVTIQREILMQDRLLPEEKISLNASLTLEELGEATLELANAKCLGPDGTPVEFYKAH